jgi:hypothetical protein
MIDRVGRASEPGKRSEVGSVGSDQIPAREWLVAVEVRDDDATVGRGVCALPSGQASLVGAVGAHDHELAVVVAVEGVDELFAFG